MIELIFAVLVLAVWVRALTKRDVDQFDDRG